MTVNLGVAGDYPFLQNKKGTAKSPLWLPQQRSNQRSCIPRSGILPGEEMFAYPCAKSRKIAKLTPSGKLTVSLRSKRWVLSWCRWNVRADQVLGIRKKQSFSELLLWLPLLGSNQRSCIPRSGILPGEEMFAYPCAKSRKIAKLTPSGKLTVSLRSKRWVLSWCRWNVRATMSLGIRKSSPFRNCFYGSHCWARTSDIMINSHALYRLS